MDPKVTPPPSLMPKSIDGGGCGRRGGGSGGGDPRCEKSSYVTPHVLATSPSRLNFRTRLNISASKEVFFFANKQDSTPHLATTDRHTPCPQTPRTDRYNNGTENTHNNSNQTARSFLEGSEGFSAAGRRALRAEAEGGWMARAAADGTFSSKEKEKLGLVADDAVLDGNGTQDGAGGGGGEESLHGGEEQQVVVMQEAELAGKSEHAAAASERSVDGSACSSSGTPPQGLLPDTTVAVDVGDTAAE